MSPTTSRTLRNPKLEAFAIETAAPEEEAQAREAVRAVLGEGWMVSPFGDRGTDYEVLPERGKGLSTAEAWDRTYALRRQPGILYAEPLYQVEAPDEGGGEEGFEAIGGGGEPHRPGSEKLEWSVELVRVPEAWELIRAKGKEPGEGVVIGHPDTGYRPHPEVVDNLLVDRGYDFLEDDQDALDDLVNPGDVVIHNPGHGAGTASVIVSPKRADGEGEGPDVCGVAPAARVIPLRVARSVVLVSTRNLARAIEYAADQGAHVVSISMGGLFSSRLRKAVLYAQRRGVIVLSAAGNKVRFVVWPAAYEEVIAVSACNVDRRPWSGSSRGDAVDVVAPGESVWRAGSRLVDGAPEDFVARGSGTSFAVATTAGIAALWLSYHGRDALASRYGAEKIPFVFNDILRATAVPQPGIGPEYGRGLVDARAVLEAPLPGTDEEGLESLGVAPPAALEAHPPVDNGGLATFAHLLGPAADSGFEGVAEAPSPRLRGALAELLGVSRERLPERLHEVGQELAFHVATRPELFEQLEAMVSTRESVHGGDAARVRETLRAGEVSEVLRRRTEGVSGAESARPAAPPATPEPDLEAMLGGPDEDACGLVEGARPPEAGGVAAAPAPAPPRPVSLPSAPPAAEPGGGPAAPGGPVEIRVTRDEVRILVDPAALVPSAPAAPAAPSGAVAREAAEAAEMPAVEELEAPGFVGLTSVPADKHGQGYGSLSIRADLKEPYLRALRKVRALGGILTSSGGIRDLGAAVSAGRSGTSLHYTGRAIDLYIHTGMRSLEDRYAIVRDGGSEAHPLWKVYCLSRSPATDDPLYDPALIREMELTCSIWRSGQAPSTHRRSGRWICLTDLLAAEGWHRIPSRSSWRQNYLSVEWWHFQHHQGLSVGQSRFGAELTRVWPAARVQSSGLALNAVWSGLSFRSA